tara:strand:+ start:94 stop:759 length:666 start_codon:yes stop_codon:yes gene_type:complete
MKSNIQQKIVSATFFLIIMLLISPIKAQMPTYKTWLELSFEQKIKIKKFKFKVSISQGLRINDLIYNTKCSALTEVGVSKKVAGFYKLGLSYRAIYIGRFKNRLALSNTFKLKVVKDLNLSFRLKYQAEFEENNPFSQDFRLKSSFKWDAHKDVRPYLFGEILYNDTYNYSNFNEYRVGLGINVDFKKKHQFNVMLMYSQEFNKEAPGSGLFLSLAYAFAR